MKYQNAFTIEYKGHYIQGCERDGKEEIYVYVVPRFNECVKKYAKSIKGAKNIVTRCINNPEKYSILN